MLTHHHDTYIKMTCTIRGGFKYRNEKYLKVRGLYYGEGAGG